ncbi:MAG: FAD-dependent oxidoreductase [Nitrospirae bacterium]|nr:FAD-dependent oxidoreductase [Nitrospirota bacterium]
MKDMESKITLVSKEGHLPYTPTALPYFIKGKIEEKRFFLRPREFYDEKQVTLVLGDEVVGVDPVRRTAATRSGRQLAFDKLLITTGAVPIVPRIKGVDDKRAIVFRTLEDARKIRSFSEKSRKVCILGAGLVGMQLAEILTEKGLKATVIEAESQILPRNYDEACAGIIEEIFIEHGVEILRNSRALSFEPTKDGISVVLEKGRTVHADFLIVGVGTRPAIDLIRESGIAYNRGIVVDDSMRTNYPDIYAAGDVAEAKDFFGEEKILNQLLPDAAEQGKVAGLNMSGEAARYEGGINMTTFNFFDCSAFSMGIFREQPNTYFARVESSPEQRKYRKLVFDVDRLVGAIFLNENVSISLLVNYLKKKIDYPLRKEEIDSDFETAIKHCVYRHFVIVQSL